MAFSFCATDPLWFADVSHCFATAVLWSPKVCDLDLSINGAGEVALQYADMETICSCVVDVATGRITGQVQQLIHGDDGWMHPSDDATHT